MSSGWINEQLGIRNVFEHYRIRDASLGLDSGAWEDTNGDDGLAPSKLDVNMDRDALLSHMNISMKEDDTKPSIASHYGRSKVFRAPQWHYLDQPGQGNIQQKDETISNNELYMTIVGVRDKERCEALIRKLNPLEDNRYCLKFGCTRFQKTNGLCKVHYDKKRKNPSLSMTRHAYCNMFSFFSSVGLSDEEEKIMFLGPGEDSDVSFSSECGDLDDEEECHYGEESSYCVEDSEEELEKEQEECLGECSIGDKCIVYSCYSGVFCKKMGLCKKHYYVDS